MRLFLLLLLLPFTLLAMGKSEVNKTVIVMLGAPGAGKGTQAIKASETFDLPHISTGDLFRENIKNDTPIGKKVRAYMDAGTLAPDEVLLEMLYARIKRSDCANGYILDGCPRTVGQAEALDHELKNTRIVAINLDVPDEEIVRRISNRFVCEVCGAPYDAITNPPKAQGICNRDGGKLIKRKDDTPEVVRARLAVYHEVTAPVKDYYAKNGRLIEIDGKVSKEEITASIEQVMRSI